MVLLWPTIGTNGFSMVFPLETMFFQWFPMVGNHWSNDGMVMIHRYGLDRANKWMGSWAGSTQDWAQGTCLPLWLDTLVQGDMAGLMLICTFHTLFSTWPDKVHQGQDFL